MKNELENLSCIWARCLRWNGCLQRSKRHLRKREITNKFCKKLYENTTESSHS